MSAPIQPKTIVISMPVAVIYPKVFRVNARPASKTSGIHREYSVKVIFVLSTLIDEDRFSNECRNPKSK